MPKKISTPRHLDDWVHTLDKVVLPADAESLNHALRALNGSSSSLREIAEHLMRCPVLALSLLRAANQSSLHEPTSSFEGALTRLGIGRTEALLRALPTQNSENTPRALLQLLQMSRHAAVQANGLFAHRLARLAQEVHCSSLLLLAPLWTLACRYPELMLQWEQRVLLNHEASKHVEHDLLGTSIRHICQRLAERWHLPEWITQSYRVLNDEQQLLIQTLRLCSKQSTALEQQQRLDDAPTLRRSFSQPSNTALLANAIALAAHRNWSSAPMLRWQRFCALYLQTSLGAVQQQIHQNAALSARQEPRNLWHPACALLWPQGTEHLRTAKPKPAVSDLTLWRQHCTQLLQKTTPFANALQLLSCAGHALHACGIARYALLTPDRQHILLATRHTHGLVAGELTQPLPLSQSWVLRKLLESPQQLRLTPTNMARFSALLCAPIKEAFDSHHLVLHSIGIHGKVSALLIADMNGAAFHEQQLQALSKTMQCTERALLVFSQRGTH